MRFDLGKAIDEYNRTRREPGEPLMTQRRLAQTIGTAEALVSRHVNRRVAPRAETLIKYARALRCGIEDLFSDDSDMPLVA